MCREFYNQIVGERLNDFIQEEDALFLSAQAGVHDLVRHYEGQNIAITPLPGMEKEAVRQVLEQLERIHRYAITDQKLKELTDNYRLGLKQSAAMLRRMPNSVYLKVYQDHFLLGYPLAEVAEKLDAASIPLTAAPYMPGSTVGMPETSTAFMPYRAIIRIIRSRTAKP